MLRPSRCDRTMSSLPFAVDVPAAQAVTVPIRAGSLVPEPLGIDVFQLGSA